MPQIKTSTGSTMNVSQEAWDTIYSKYPQRYTLLASSPPTQTPEPAPAGMVTIYSGGTSNTVPAGDVSYWKSRGWSEGSASAPTPPPTQVSSPTGEQYGGTTEIKNGIDQAGWTEAMKESYAAMQDYVKKLEAQGKAINPNIKIDDATLAKFTEQAKTELAPYYKQIFDIAQKDVETAFSRISEDYATRERDIGLQYGKSLENTQESYARRGLAFSSDRQKSEKELADETQRNLDLAAQTATRGAMDTGLAAERKLGSASFDAPTTGIATGTRPITGLPGQYGLTGGTGTQQLYSAQGGLTGDLERNKLFEEESRKNELTSNERSLRSQLYL